MDKLEDMPEQLRPPNVENLFQLDGYLRSYEQEIVRRYSVFHENLKRIEQVNIPFIISSIFTL